MRVCVNLVIYNTYIYEKNKLKLYAIMIFVLLCTEVHCQKVAIKSNLLYDVTATVNAGIEVGLAPKWTCDLSANYNGWTFSHERKWKHWLLQPEGRYWFCDRFAGHFVGVHALGGQYNIGNLNNHISFLGTDLSVLSDRRYQGWFAGGGIAYGYAWILNKRWNLEAELGLGWIYTRYDSYPCTQCGTKIADGKSHNYVGPTKAAVNLIYTF